MKESSSLAHGEKCRGTQRGWRSRLLGLSSPAHTPTRRSPHGVGKLSRIAALGQSLCTAIRRPWLLFVSLKRTGGAFFVAYRGPEPRWERHKGLVGQRRPPEADESRLAGRSAAASDPRHGESPCLPSPGGATPRTGTQEARAWDSRGRSLAQAWLAGRVAAPAQLWPLGPQSPVAVYWPHKDVTNCRVIQSARRSTLVS